MDLNRLVEENCALVFLLRLLSKPSSTNDDTMRSLMLCVLAIALKMVAVTIFRQLLRRDFVVRAICFAGLNSYFLWEVDSIFANDRYLKTYVVQLRSGMGDWLAEPGTLSSGMAVTYRFGWRPRSLAGEKAVDRDCCSNTLLKKETFL